MAMTPYGGDPLVISKLGTTPQERGLETQEFKAKFDEGLKGFVEWFNLTHKTEFEAKAEQDDLEDLAGAERTIETVKGNADAIEAHEAENVTDADGAHGLKIEEGAWTPVVYGSTTPGTNTYSAQNGGRYYKIGKLVYVQARIALTVKDAAMAGSIIISGLPFTVRLGYAGATLPIAIMQGVDLPTGYSFANAQANPNDTTISLRRMGDAVASISVVVSEISASFMIDISGTYQTT